MFVGGEASKVARVRKELPDAVYAEWGRIRSAIKGALRNRPKEPRVPGTMDAYSGTPLEKKLGIRAGMRVALLGGPEGFARSLGAVGKRITIRRQARGQSEVVVLFAGSCAELKRRLGGAKRVLEAGGALWIAWPKKASGVKTDLTQAVVRKTGLGSGLVDYKICAIDGTWSGLCFARRGSGQAKRG